MSLSRMAPRGLAVAVVLWLWGAPARAEEPGLGPGMRVRVTSTGDERGRLVGNVHAIDQRTLTVISGGRIVHVPRERVARLEVSGGRKRNLLKGLLVGVPTGLLLGAVLPVCDSYTSTCSTRGELVSAGLASGVLLGGGIGAVTRSDRWVEMPGAGLRLGAALPYRGARGAGPTTALGLSLTIRF